VREARSSGIVLTGYGRASGFCIDPIEKKPLSHFLPGTSTLSFGTAGCNLGCRFCQNWNISKARAADRLNDWASPDTIARSAVKAGCRSLAFTYNDPVIFAEYAIDCAQAARALGIRSVAVTAGYISLKARPALYGAMDGINVDLKAFTDRFYRRLCLGTLEPVKETLVWIHRESRAWLEVTTLLIPGENDSELEIGRLCDWYLVNLGPDVPLHFTAFHPSFKLMNVSPTPPATLRRARAQALRCGLRYVYTGNTHDPEGQSTWCANCNACLIQRDQYRVLDWALDGQGRCLACGAPVPGHFEPPPAARRSERRQIGLHPAPDDSS